MPFQLTLSRRMAAAIVCAAAVTVYLGTVHNYYVQDDFGVVWLLSQKPATFFPQWFVIPWMEDIWGYTPDEIRPFPALSYQLTASLGAGWPVPDHLVNISIHAVNAWLVMWLARAAAGVSLPGALVAGLVFAVLPIQAESVAWITGRVDSLPALFYLAAFAMFVRWRQGIGGLEERTRATTFVGRVRLVHPASPYLVSLAFFFMALLSKQNTITLAPALLLYDLLLTRGPVRPSLASLRPYLPYGALTIAYLMLRYALFSEFARESALNAQRMEAFVSDVATHLTRLVLGDRYMSLGIVAALLVVVTTVTAGWLMARTARRPGGWRFGRPAFYFGGVWLALGLAPVLVAGYSSPRHVYLASVGWAILVGICCHAAWLTMVRPAAKSLVLITVTALIVFYGLQLQQVIGDWSIRSRLSQQAVSDLERIVEDMPAGTLIVVGVSPLSWRFGMPFAVRPPFTRTDLTARVHFVYANALHCCPPLQWEASARAALRAWASAPNRAPVVALTWEDTGAVVMVDDSQRPELRSIVSLLLGLADYRSLDRAINSVLSEASLSARR